MAAPRRGFSELRVPLEPSRGELIRAFVREACLSEDVPPATANSIAEDAFAVWPGLCEKGSNDAVRILPRCSGQNVNIRILLPGYSRFSAILSEGRSILANAAVAWRPHGIDGWELRLQHRFGPLSEPVSNPPAQDDAPAAAPAAAAADQYVIEPPHQEDAAAIARCFLKVYGHSYVHPEVFSPRRYWDKVERGELIPMIAREKSGEVVGHVALERGPGTKVAERGEAVVASEHRGRGLLERMTERLSEEAVKEGLEGIYAEPVTVHTFSQRNDERAGMPVCAALLGVNPEKFGPKDAQFTRAGQRQSYLRTSRFLGTPQSRTLHAPECYREVLLDLYAAIGAPVAIAGPSSKLPAESRTAVKVNGRGYAVVAFDQIGSKAPVELGQAFRDVRALGASTVQLSGPVGDPGLPGLVEAARGFGFFFCGLGPGFADGADMVSLQWLSEPLDTGKLQLLTEGAKRLVAFIDRDRAAVAPSLA
jgi:acetyltransferase (GNAT) family protein